MIRARKSVFFIALWLYSVISANQEARAEQQARYQQLTMTCSVATQAREVTVIWDAYLENEDVISTLTNVAFHLDEHKIDCGWGLNKPTPVVTPRIRSQKNLRSIAVYIVGAIVDEAQGQSFQEAHFSMRFADNPPLIWMDESGTWIRSEVPQDYAHYVDYLGPAGIFECADGKSPSVSQIVSKIYIQSALASCALDQGHGVQLIFLGLGNYSWRTESFDRVPSNQLPKLGVEHAGYFALSFELYRSLLSVLKS
jgi:hypothetical protein